MKRQQDLFGNIADEYEIVKYHNDKQKKEKKEYKIGEKDKSRARQFIFSPELINAIDLDHVRTGYPKNDLASDGIRLHLIQRKYCPDLHLERFSEKELRLIFSTVQSFIDMIPSNYENDLNMINLKNIDLSRIMAII